MPHHPARYQLVPFELERAREEALAGAPDDHGHGPLEVVLARLGRGLLPPAAAPRVLRQLLAHVAATTPPVDEPAALTVLELVDRLDAFEDALVDQQLDPVVLIAAVALGLAPLQVQCLRWDLPATAGADGPGDPLDSAEHLTYALSQLDLLGYPWREAIADRHDRLLRARAGLR